jgi:hypothetical protein
MTGSALCPFLRTGFPSPSSYPAAGLLRSFLILDSCVPVSSFKSPFKRTRESRSSLLKPCAMYLAPYTLPLAPVLSLYAEPCTFLLFFTLSLVPCALYLISLKVSGTATREATGASNLVLLTKIKSNTYLFCNENNGWHLCKR